MSNVSASLEQVLLPFAVKLGKQPHVHALKNGLIRFLPVTRAGGRVGGLQTVGLR
ncbi:hypothetical protein ACQWF5_25160, partial [Salmonella enterica subsp. enterica serovar Infantis]